MTRLHITLATLRTPLDSLTHLSALTAIREFALKDLQVVRGG